MKEMPKDPCIWAWKQYAQDLDVKLMTQRLYIIDREIERLRIAVDKLEGKHEVGHNHPSVG